jgi:hypothetical protein
MGRGFLLGEAQHACQGKQQQNQCHRHGGLSHAPHGVPPWPILAFGNPLMKRITDSLVR